MLRNWLAIDSNDIKKPAPFYHLLLHSLQVVATSPTLLNDVRKWLITSTIDPETDLYLKPKLMMTLMINYAKLIGLPRSQGSLLAMGNEKQSETKSRMRNNCKTCDFSTCDSETRGGVTKCRMMHKSCRTPTWASKLTEGQTAYMKAGDDYMVANPGTTTLKGVKLTIPPRPAGAARTRPAARGRQPQVTPVLGHAGSSSEATDAEMFKAFVASRTSEAAMPVIMVVPIIKLDCVVTKQQCVDVIGYTGTIAPTVCLLDLLAPDVLAMIARSISDLDYNYWNPTPSVLATRLPCRAMMHAIDMHAAVQYYGRVGPWIQATARAARWAAAPAAPAKRSFASPADAVPRRALTSRSHSVTKTKPSTPAAPVAQHPAGQARPAQARPGQARPAQPRPGQARPARQAEDAWRPPRGADLLDRGGAVQGRGHRRGPRGGELRPQLLDRRPRPLRRAEAAQTAQGHIGEKDVRLAQNMQVGTCIPV